MAKKKEKKERTVLVFFDGTRREVTGEEGRYWECGKVRYRKANPGIAGVELIVPEPEKEEEEEAEPDKEKEA